MKLQILVMVVALALSTLAAAEERTFGGSSGGRYQIVQLSQYRRDQYLIDSQTGALWQLTCLKAEANDCSASVWTRQYVEGLNMSPAMLNKLRNNLNKVDISDLPPPPAQH